jgi:inositol oxygenase
MGIYTKNCGLDNCIVSWGHDEFLYRTLLNNKHSLPEEALYIVRYHSLYLWHDKNEYIQFENKKDIKMKYWVKLFNKYDLYSKENKKVNIEELKGYYLNLYMKYFHNRKLCI